MSYYNYIDHPRYGRIWYAMTLRNWYCLGYSERQNLNKGPCIEIIARDYSLVGGGKTIEEAHTSLWTIINWYADKDKPLPLHRKPVRSSLRTRWRYWRMVRRQKRDGELCRITKDTGR